LENPAQGQLRYSAIVRMQAFFLTLEVLSMTTAKPKTPAIFAQCVWGGFKRLIGFVFCFCAIQIAFTQ
jgi:hypothetical protein